MTEHDDGKPSMDVCRPESPNFDPKKCEELQKKVDEILEDVINKLEILNFIKEFVLKTATEDGIDAKTLDDALVRITQYKATQFHKLEKFTGRVMLERCPKCSKVLLKRVNNIPELMFVQKQSEQ